MLKVFVFLCTILPAALSFAHDYKHASFHADHPWARPTFALATTGAVYLTLDYLGDSADRLVAASVSPAIAAEVQIHDVIVQGDVMQMRHQKDGVAFQASESVSFAPGGKHIMLLGLAGPLKDGSQFDMTLHFEKADDLAVVVKVENPKEQPQEDHSHHHNHE